MTAATALKAVREHMRENGIDAWLVYTFYDSNPVFWHFCKKLGFVSRRAFYILPSEGAPTLLCSYLDQSHVRPLAGRKELFSGRAEMVFKLGRLLGGSKRVAMEYSPKCNTPYVSRVDAGTKELVESLGLKVVPSGDLFQHAFGRWTPSMERSHARAAKVLEEAKDAALDFMRDALRSGRRITEYDVQQEMMSVFAARKLDPQGPPIVACGPNGADPHYVPSKVEHSPIRLNQPVVLDLWGKIGDNGTYADITWMAFTGKRVPERVIRVFSTVLEARDAAVGFLKDHWKEEPEGWKVDRAARGVIEKAGFGSRFKHRTGHSIGLEGHWFAANIDDFESHETRRLVPGVAFSVEPGVYLTGEFGIRSEINVLMTSRGPRVTTCIQRELDKVF
ncbi:aminopeptidase P family protein [Candidatus Micrarchaeota archaeon]|nr:aminopeptidase P family protein [Candidatus Micrarchaeota archaeon]